METKQSIAVPPQEDNDDASNDIATNDSDNTKPGESCQVKVVLRVRPLSHRESDEGCLEALEISQSPNSDDLYYVDAGPKRFTFDNVFAGPTSTQEEVYSKSVKPLVDSCMDGYNATVLAYGQTGSGKTFTMGTNGEDCDEELVGVIPRVVRDIFARKCNSTLVHVSFLELYRENIRDLLSSSIESTSAASEPLTLREDSTGSVVVQGLHKEEVTSAETVMQIIQKGSQYRTTGSTNMNATSSRSHAIFTLHLCQLDGNGTGKTSQLHLVDLAGSERAKRTKAVGKQLKEATSINKGLLALGNVISALADSHAKSGNSYVPFRNSKLTRLLQCSLGGNSRTVMIACASPADTNLDETMNTLKYANRARKITNVPVVNEASENGNSGALVSSLKMMIAKLQAQLMAQNGSAPPHNSTQVAALKARVKELELALSRARDCIALVQSEVRLGDNNPDTQEMISAQQVSQESSSSSSSVMKELLSSLEPVLRPDNTNFEGDDKLVESKLHIDGESGDDVVSEDEQNFHSRRQRMMQELESIDRTIEAKSKTVVSLAENQEEMGEFCKSYEETVEHLSKQIERLEHERVALRQRLKNSDAGPKLRLLEKQIERLKKEHANQTKLLRVQERSLKGANRLKEEITSLKHAKVQLVRRIKAENDEFLKWKKNQEHNMKQLKRKESKQQYAYMKLERQHVKQELVLKRRTEQVAAIQKRLKDALATRQRSKLQRSEASKPLSNSSLYSGAQRVESTLMNTKSDDTSGPMQNSALPPWSGQLSTWLSEQVELECSAQLARETLEHEFEIRKSLSNQLREARELNAPSQDEIERISLSQKECSVRIKELQNLIVAATDGATTLKHCTEKEKKRTSMRRWLPVRTTREGKKLLGVLFEMFVASKSKLLSTVDDMKAENSQLKETCDELRARVLRMQEENSTMQSESEEKLLVLMKQMNIVGGASFNNKVSTNKAQQQQSRTSEDVLEAIKNQMELQQEEIDRLSMLQEELVLVRQERDLLKQEVEELSNSESVASEETTLLVENDKTTAESAKREVSDSSNEKHEEVESQSEYDEDDWMESETDEDVPVGDSDSDWEDVTVKRTTSKRVNRSSTGAKSTKSSIGIATNSVVDQETLLSELPEELVSRVRDMKKVQLQNSLRYLELTITGRKDVLCERLLTGLYIKLLQVRKEKLSDEITVDELLPTELPSRGKQQSSSSGEQVDERSVTNTTETQLAVATTSNENTAKQVKSNVVVVRNKEDVDAKSSKKTKHARDQNIGNKENATTLDNTRMKIGSKVGKSGKIEMKKNDPQSRKPLGQANHNTMKAERTNNQTTLKQHFVQPFGNSTNVEPRQKSAMLGRPTFFNPQKKKNKVQAMPFKISNVAE